MPLLPAAVKDWEDSPSTNTPITAAELERMESVALAGARTTVRQLTGATTLALVHEAEMLAINSAAAVNVTIPADATVNFPVGARIQVAQIGAGIVTVVGATGVVVQSPRGFTTIKQYGIVSLVKWAANSWLVAPPEDDPGTTGGGTALTIAQLESYTGGIALEGFTGGTDDAKLTEYVNFCLNIVSPDSRPKLILGESRQYTFDCSLGRVAFEGLKIEMPGGIGGNVEQGVEGLGAYIQFTGSGTWWTATTASAGRTAAGYVFGIGFRNLSIKGGASCNVISSDASTVIYSMVWDGGNVSGIQCCFGTPTLKALMVDAKVMGPWNSANTTHEFLRAGGSDCNFFLNGLTIDSPPSLHPGGGTSGRYYHLNFDYMEKTNVGPLYMTVRGAWCGIGIAGPTTKTAGASNLGGPMFFHGCRIEGRNATSEQAFGALVRINGGMASFSQCWLSYAMTEPTTHGITWLGVIELVAGELHLSDCWYDRASTVAESVPFVYATSTAAVLYATQVGAGWKGGLWTEEPVLSVPTGLTKIIDDISTKRVTRP